MNFQIAMRWLKGDGIPTILLAALVVFCLGRAHSLGVHCGDDALNATVAKNLVAGLGYGSTLNTGELQPFDLAITTGPAVILPATLGIAVAGNRPWVPGTASVLLWGTLMVVLYGILKKTGGDWPPGALRDGAVFFLLAIPLLFPFHFELWSSLLGEAAAALFLLIAFALAGGSLSTRRVFLAGMACALAILSKLLAAPGFAVLLGVLAARSVFWGKTTWRKSAWLLLACGMGFAAPLIVFEGYKVASLGGASPYLEYVGRKASMVVGVGISKSLQAGANAGGAVEETQRPQTALQKAFKLARRHDAAFRERVGISAWQVLLTALGALWVVCRQGLSPGAWTAIATAALVWLLGGYFLFFSSGVPRHFLIGLILWIGLVAQALSSLRGGTRLAAAALVLAYLFSGNYSKMRYPLRVMDNGIFQPSEELRGALEIARAVDAERAVAGTDGLYVTQAWATAADVEFYSKNTSVFRRHTLLGDSNNFTVVYNKRFTVLEDAKFQETLAKCGPPAMETQNHVLLRSKHAAE